MIASKVYWPTRDTDPNSQGLNRSHLRQQIDAILERLGTSYLDVLYIHRWDDETPIREFMRTLSSFVDDGRVNYLGASTLVPNSWKIAKVNSIADTQGWVPFSVTQPRYSLVNREVEGEYLEMCREFGLGVLPWSPLAQGFLTGKYSRDGDRPSGAKASTSDKWERRYLTEANFKVIDELRDVADHVDGTPAQVALAWLLHHSDVTTPIVGARTVSQLTENLRASTLSLSSEDVERLSTAKPGPFAEL